MLSAAVCVLIQEPYLCPREQLKFSKTICGITLSPGSHELYSIKNGLSEWTKSDFVKNSGNFKQWLSWFIDM
jgi:hypothetical protein